MSERAAAIITGLLIDRPICLDCLTTKSHLAKAVLTRTVDLIGQNVVLRRELDRCRLCGEQKPVLSITRQ